MENVNVNYICLCSLCPSVSLCLCVSVSFCLCVSVSLCPSLSLCLSLLSYCTKAKDLFTSLSIPFHHVDLDLLPNGADIQADLADLSGQRTVPNIFIKGTHVGGCDKVHQLHTEGKLLPML